MNRHIASISLIIGEKRDANGTVYWLVNPVGVSEKTALAVRYMNGWIMPARTFMFVGRE